MCFLNFFLFLNEWNWSLFFPVISLFIISQMQSVCQIFWQFIQWVWNVKVNYSLKRSDICGLSWVKWKELKYLLRLPYLLFIWHLKQKWFCSFSISKYLKNNKVGIVESNFINLIKVLYLIKSDLSLKWYLSNTSIR